MGGVYRARQTTIIQTRRGRNSCENRGTNRRLGETRFRTPLRVRRPEREEEGEEMVKGSAEEGKAKLKGVEWVDDGVRKDERGGGGRGWSNQT